MKSLPIRRDIAINGMLGVLVVGGVGAAYLTVSGGEGDGAQTSKSSAVVTVARGTVTESVSASGTVASTSTEDVDFATSGTVKTIYIKAGDTVTKGEILARLNATSANEALTEAKLAYQEAQDNGTSTAATYSAYVTAKNNYESAKETVANTVLKAPFSGQIAELNGSVGDTTTGSGNSAVASSSSSSSSSSGSAAGGASASGSAGSSGSSSSSSSFIELVKPKSLEISGDFTEEDAGKLKVGNTAAVSFSALSGVTAKAKVTEIENSPTTSNGVVQYPVTIKLTTVPSAVRIGDSATATITIGTYSNVLYLPSAAVTTAGGRSTVVALVSGKKVTKTVTIGESGTQGVVIKSGLAEGDQVVETVTSTSSTTTTQQGTGGIGGAFPGGGTGGGFPAGGTGGGFPGGAPGAGTRGGAG